MVSRGWFRDDPSKPPRHSPRASSRSETAVSIASPETGPPFHCPDRPPQSRPTTSRAACTPLREPHKDVLDHSRARGAIRAAAVRQRMVPDNQVPGFARDGDWSERLQVLLGRPRPGFYELQRDARAADSDPDRARCPVVVRMTPSQSGKAKRSPTDWVST